MSLRTALLGFFWQLGIHRMSLRAAWRILQPVGFSWSLIFFHTTNSTPFSDSRYGIYIKAFL